MNEELNPLSTSAICVGCLACDRNLKALTDGETKVYYEEFLDCFDNTKDPVLLCWECMALLQKSFKFKKQVKLAKNFLISCLYNNSPLTTLSNLKITKTKILNLTEDSTYKKNTQNLKLFNDSNTDSQIHKHLTSINIDSTYRDSTYQDSKVPDSTNQTNVLVWQLPEIVKVDADFSDSKDFEHKYEFNAIPDSIVKTEDSNGSFDGGHFADDNDNGNVDTYNDIEKVDVDCPQIAEPLAMKRKPDDSYDASDDEPLVKKRREKKSRKKKKKAATPTRVPGKRREKPAGVVSNPRVERKLKQLNVATDQLEMVLLSWQEVEEERQRSLSSETFTRHQYRCYDCALGFNYRIKLENHMKKHDPSAGELVCEVCKIHCKNAHALSAHRRRHRVRWRCRLCGGTWSRAGVAADHHARQHGAPPPTHTCTTCGHTDTSLGKLRNHMKNHAERQKCELCGKTFRNKDSLRTHLFIHKGEKEYACTVCDKRFLLKRALHVHLVTHDAPALLYCHQCDMNFKNRMSYAQHMRYSLKHVDPAKLKHACKLCDKKFLKAARLEEHNLAVHLKATPFHCTVPGCNFASSSRPVLRSHVRMSHQDARARRNYVCHACGKAYKNKKTLEGHLRSHSGERPFRCTHCAASFGYEAALYNHNKVVHRRDKGVKKQPQAVAPPAPTEWIPT